MGIDRRTFIETATSTAAGLALAGCTNATQPVSEQRPENTAARVARTDGAGDGSLGALTAYDDGDFAAQVEVGTEALFQFDAVQNHGYLYPLGVPARAVRRGGYVRIVNVLFGELSTHPGKPSERCHIARRRPFPG